MKKIGLLACMGLCLTAAARLLAQGGRYQVQKPSEIQQPKGNWQVPGKIHVPRDISKVKEPCKSRLIASSDALFEFDKAELTQGAEKVLSELGPLIRREGSHPISIEGHTDGKGEPAHNQRLSERRARTVEAWLEARGYLQVSAPLRGFGKTKPIAPETKPDGSDNPEGRQKNRRVEVVIDTCKSA